MDWTSLIDWLSKKDQLGAINYYSGAGMRPGATFDPADKSITLRNADQLRSSDRTLMHELIHALQFSTLPNRFQTINQDVAELQKMSGGGTLAQQLVYPTHWDKDQVEDERVSARIDHPMANMVYRTNVERRRATNRMTEQYVPELRPYEQQAYYLTSQGVGAENQLKQLGMYLRNYGVPWQTIEDLKLYKKGD